MTIDFQVDGYFFIENYELFINDTGLHLRVCDLQRVLLF